METEGVGFTEAVERLASMAGMALPAATPDAARHEQRRKTLHDVMELAAKFFADTLASRNGAKARGYLGDRAHFARRRSCSSASAMRRRIALR